MIPPSHTPHRLQHALEALPRASLSIARTSAFANQPRAPFSRPTACTLLLTLRAAAQPRGIGLVDDGVGRLPGSRRHATVLHSQTSLLLSLSRLDARTAPVPLGRHHQQRVQQHARTHNTPKDDRAFALLARAAGAYASEMQQATVGTVDGGARLARALERIEDVLVFFIQRSGADEQYMKTFDETPVGENPTLDTARTAVAQTLKGVAWDVSLVEADHPVRAENEMLNLQIVDLIEVCEGHLTDMNEMPADWKAFWSEVYLLMHGLGSSLTKANEQSPFVKV